MEHPLCCIEGALARAVQENVRRACGWADPQWVASIPSRRVYTGVLYFRSCRLDVGHRGRPHSVTPCLAHNAGCHTGARQTIRMIKAHQHFNSPKLIGFSKHGGIYRLTSHRVQRTSLREHACSPKTCCWRIVVAASLRSGKHYCDLGIRNGDQRCPCMANMH